jgi:alpha-tubulin suppressor-like RCC1 family protein
MTFGVNNTINCVNQSALRTDLTSLELLQLTGSECQFNDKCAVFSVACQASLPTASCNTGRFVYITSECKYYFSTGSVWTDNVSGITSSAWAWGEGAVGRLGDNTIDDKSSPVSVIGGYTDWLQVSAGGDHSSGLRSNGTARTWGGNSSGELGDGTIISKRSPVSVVGDFTDWCQLSSGSAHMLGVRTNGTAWAWGCGGVGRLGDNTTVNKSSPVSVVGILNWSQLSAGPTHSVGLRQNGTVWAWGSNNNGELGDNTGGVGTSKSSPVSVIGGFTDWCQVSTGFETSLAVRTNGTAWAWGKGCCGSLGNNSTTDRSSPVSVVGGFTDWCQISGGSGGLNHSLAVRTNGTAWAWGLNDNGQLGDNTITKRSSPVSVVGGYTDWCQVSAGTSHSLGLRTNGTAWAWGQGTLGRLGDNTVADKSSPVSVVGGYTDWWDISAGSDFSLAIRKSCGI